MSQKSAIEWTDTTWNPIIGCQEVSPGCDHCYARELHNRRHIIYKRNGGSWIPGGPSMPEQYHLPFGQVQLIPGRLPLPLLNKKPRRIFVNSLSDLFHKEVPDEFILQIFRVMAQADWHIFQVLTKRPSRAVLLSPQILEALGGH